nr:hypothetical protein Itr_chr06CG11910 [Ipomoea trifida]
MDHIIDMNNRMSAIEEHDALTGNMNVLIEVESTSSIDHSYAILG